MDDATRLVVGSQITYLVVTVAVTIWVGRTLYSNGHVFLVDAFAGNEKLAASVNHLLVVGFYLINVGYVALALGGRPLTAADAVEGVSGRIGAVLLVLGAMHFFNLFLFSRFRKRALLKNEPPPVLPTEWLAPEEANEARATG